MRGENWNFGVSCFSSCSEVRSWVSATTADLPGRRRQPTPTRATPGGSYPCSSTRAKRLPIVTAYKNLEPGRLAAHFPPFFGTSTKKKDFTPQIIQTEAVDRKRSTHEIKYCTRNYINIGVPGRNRTENRKILFHPSLNQERTGIRQTPAGVCFSSNKTKINSVCNARNSHITQGKLCYQVPNTHLTKLKIASRHCEKNFLRFSLSLNRKPEQKKSYDSRNHLIYHENASIEFFNLYVLWNIHIYDKLVFPSLETNFSSAFFIDFHSPERYWKNCLCRTITAASK